MRRKIRRCRTCGAILSETRIALCESCQAAGMGREIRSSIDAEELLTVARARELFGIRILDEMSLDEIAALARMWSAPYNTYGRFRGYVDTMGRLPPEDYRK